MYVCMYVCVCVCVCVCVYVYACMHLCLCVPIDFGYLQKLKLFGHFTLLIFSGVVLRMVNLFQALIIPTNAVRTPISCLFQAMLKRLEGAKATTTLRKDKLLNEFNNQRMAGVPMGAVHPLARGRRSSAGLRSPSPYGDQPRSRSGMSDVSSVRSGSTAGGRPQSAKSVQRPQSGKRSRPQSAKMVPSSRPDWESGW